MSPEFNFMEALEATFGEPTNIDDGIIAFGLKNKNYDNKYMATRLYPLTKNEASLEKMANVPEGTMNRLNVLLDSRASYDVSDAFYEAIAADADAQQLYHFILFGWGRVRYPITDYAGTTTDPKLVKAMLDAQVEATDTNLALCEGVCWG